MTSKHPERIIILTYDLKLNRTFTTRYFSFIKALKAHGHQVKGVGIDFTFNPHPINNLDKSEEVALEIADDIITIRPKKLNFIQKLLTISDRFRVPFFLKKYLLALHIVLYKKDQWVTDVDDFNQLVTFNPTIIIAGATGGIVETAYSLSKKFGAKLILDYRDPWNLGYNLLETNLLANRFKKKFTIKRELFFLSKANHVITVSQSIKSYFPKEILPKVTIIENGSNFEQTEAELKSNNKQNRFNILYLGTVYDEQLAKPTFFKALEVFIAANNISTNDFQLLFLGASKNKLLPKILHEFNLQPFTKTSDRVRFNELKEILNDASMFLHLRYGDRSKIITSKQADYLLFRKPILLPLTDNGDIAESITSNKAGYVLEGDVDSIINVLQNEYNKFLAGTPTTLPYKDFSYLSRSKIAEKILEIIP